MTVVQFFFEESHDNMIDQYRPSTIILNRGPTYDVQSRINVPYKCTVQCITFYVYSTQSRVKRYKNLPGRAHVMASLLSQQTSSIDSALSFETTEGTIRLLTSYSSSPTTLTSCLTFTYLSRVLQSLVEHLLYVTRDHCLLLCIEGVGNLVWYRVTLRKKLLLPVVEPS